MVPLPVAFTVDTYKVLGTLGGVAVIVGFDCPNLIAADRTLTQFRFVATTAMTAGDRIDFWVIE